MNFVRSIKKDVVIGEFYKKHRGRYIKSQPLRPIIHIQNSSIGNKGLCVHVKSY